MVDNVNFGDAKSESVDRSDCLYFGTIGFSTSFFRFFEDDLLDVVFAIFCDEDKALFGIWEFLEDGLDDLMEATFGLGDGVLTRFEERRCAVARD